VHRVGRKENTFYSFSKNIENFVSPKINPPWDVACPRLVAKFKGYKARAELGLARFCLHKWSFDKVNENLEIGHITDRIALARRIAGEST